MAGANLSKLSKKITRVLRDACQYPRGRGRLARSILYFSSSCNRQTLFSERLNEENAEAGRDKQRYRILIYR